MQWSDVSQAAAGENAAAVRHVEPGGVRRPGRVADVERAHRPWHDGAVGRWPSSIGGVGLVAPAAIKPVYMAWMVVAFPIGWTVSKVVLAAMLYLVFTPLALVFRLMGRDALDMRLRRPAGESYWKAKPSARSGDEYLRQF